VKDNPREIADGVLFLRTMMVNLFIVRQGTGWVLVDCGLRGYHETIRRAARQYVGGTHPPLGVVLTHAHFDHVGSLPRLLEEWDVPVYAHPLERPYLTGLSSYPPPDPLVGGGSMALLSPLYPRGPIDIGHRLYDVTEPGGLAVMSDWRWVHTPGHCAGHIGLFRERDRTLLCGDALTTTKQESALAVATQRREMHGPPAYFTQDWRAARESAGRLAALEPEVLASGHGEPWSGADMRRALRDLASHFTEREVPSFGRYVRHPALTDARGIVSLPPDPLPKVIAGAAVAAALTWSYARGRRAHTAPPAHRRRTA